MSPSSIVAAKPSKLDRAGGDQVHGPGAVATLRIALEAMAGRAEHTADPHLRALYL